MAEWKRPESVPYPSIWSTFQRKNANGVSKTYWIQDVTEEYKEAFLEQIGKGFLTDEPICKAINFIQDQESVEEFLKNWDILLQDRLGLICLTKDEYGDIKIVGGNLTARYLKGKHSDLKGKALQRQVTACAYVKAKKDIFTELNIDSYLMEGGLYVLPEFRRQGIATEILRARQGLCLSVGIDVAAALFTSPASQKCAVQAGFKDFTEETIEELQKKNPDMWTFPGLSEITKSLKFMYADYR